jgi:hypothetical protein
VKITTITVTVTVTTWDNNTGIAAYVQNRLKESAHPPLASSRPLQGLCLDAYILGTGSLVAVTAVCKQGDGQAHFITLRRQYSLVGGGLLGRQERDETLLVGPLVESSSRRRYQMDFECADDDRTSTSSISPSLTVLYATPLCGPCSLLPPFQVNWLLIVCIALSIVQ